MGNQQWHTGKVIRIESAAAGTRRFFVEVEGLDDFKFKPGQFVTLDLPIHEKPNKRWRSYSIASWPDGTNVFELCIVLLEGGAGTRYLFNEVSVGHTLTFMGPLGVFTLPEVIEKELFFICTGTGIAPFRSMLHHIAMHNVPHRGIHLLFGTRRRENLLYYEDMRHLTELIPHFHYWPTLSREEWEGNTGYVHQIYEDILKPKISEKGCAEECHVAFYLCGWKDMIDEAKKRIQELGFSRKCIHQELYG